MAAIVQRRAGRTAVARGKVRQVAVPRVAPSDRLLVFGRPARSLDGWTWVQFAGGLVLGIAGLKWRWAVAFIIAVQGVEAIARRARKDKRALMELDAWKAIGTDVALGVLGFAMGKQPA